ncbi:MAG: tRNA lysidine(34) synthetase TilS [Alphaproteobacteria bacterium]
MSGVITQKEFNAILKTDFVFEDKPNIGLCVSGGVDSLALFLLMQKWIKECSGKLFVFHFNHNLRNESSSEAGLLKSKLNEFGHKVFVLDWKRNSKTKINMRVARDFRYKSIINLCEKMSILHLMTAHHQDDNLETFYMRSKRAHTSLGLSSIPKKTIVGNVQIIRPLISLSKERMISTCKYHKIDWFNDPSNKSLVYERPRIREEFFLKKKNEMNKILQSFKQIKKLNTKLEDKISSFFISNISFQKYGVFEINKNKYEKCDLELQIEILKKILTTCAGKIYPPRKKSILFFLNKLRKFSNFKHTLHSCIIFVSIDKIIFYKEIPKNTEMKSKKVLKNIPYFWNNRFYLSSKKYNVLCERITLGKWKRINKKFCLKKSEINFLILRSLPLIKVSKNYLIPFLTDEGILDDYGIEFYFMPQIPLTIKNYF